MNRPKMNAALQTLDSLIGDPRQGLPEEIFLFASSITPMVNADLLVRDDEGRILLSWRDDEHSGQGWHVPGGIVRFQETLEERLQKTALREFGSPVEFDPRPLEHVEFIERDHRERGHFVTFVYACRLPAGWNAASQPWKPGEAGYLAWHAAFPENMIQVHHYYRKYFPERSRACP
ncbi:MAG: NUDIX domain-containing protein [Planctomycetota bacterium]|jgi:colanic acid biosynthesis protein WcaH|nr:NUDIX domain-containing protein [Planctomycetota bacterium]